MWTMWIGGKGGQNGQPDAATEATGSSAVADADATGGNLAHVQPLRVVRRATGEGGQEGGSVWRCRSFHITRTLNLQVVT